MFEKKIRWLTFKGPRAGDSVPQRDDLLHLVLVIGTPLHIVLATSTSILC